KNRLDARHGESGARVDPPHARMGHGAEEQLAEEHAVRAEVFRILCPPGYFGEQIRRRVVLANESVVSHRSPSPDVKGPNQQKYAPHARLSTRSRVHYHVRRTSTHFTVWNPNDRRQAVASRPAVRCSWTGPVRDRCAASPSDGPPASRRKYSARISADCDRRAETSLHHPSHR